MLGKVSCGNALEILLAESPFCCCCLSKNCGLNWMSKLVDMVL